MKVILTQDVSGLGNPGDIVEVKDGYGRNFLVPRGLAMRWTRGAEKQAAKEQLENLVVTLPVRAGDTGRLFGSVTVGDIAEAVKAAGGPELDKRRIVVGLAIKTIGPHRVTVQLRDDVTATVKLDVVPA
jgi:large subunit ribosomal protein L9